MPKKLYESAALTPTTIRLSEHTRRLLGDLGKKFGSQGTAITVALELLAREPYRKK
jgi:hypothetical protein